MAGMLICSPEGKLDYLKCSNMFVCGDNFIISRFLYQVCLWEHCIYSRDAICLSVGTLDYLKDTNVFLWEHCSNCRDAIMFACGNAGY